jgi:hypothetical protein
MEFTCEKCGWWADVNGVCVCGYSGRPTTMHDSCPAWKTSIVTNADRLRAMSDEELAEELSGIETGVETYGKGVFSHWLDWLRQEASDG